jgi:hypothetical protein
VALWEIRIINQEPVRVDVEDERNLTEEYTDFDAYHEGTRWWKFWRPKLSPYWQITDSVVVHKDAVVGVVPRKPKMQKQPIGFYTRG